MWFGIAAAVGNTIAAGIVRPPGDIAQRLPNTYLFLGVWVVGGVYALVGASSMAELGASIPRSGGQYNFSRRAIETVRKSLLRRWCDFQGPQANVTTF